MYKSFCLGAVSLLLLPWAEQAIGDVYKYVDNTGHVFYTDVPSHSGYRRVIRTPITVYYGRGLTRTGPARASRAVERNRKYFSSLIEAAANKYSLDPGLLHAVIRAESSYNPEAVSHKGAVGLMQLMPATAARYGVRDRRDPEENIDGGAAYLSDLIQLFRSDVRLAVAAYNAGENAVIRHGYKIPPIPETRDYVVRVLDYYQRMN